MNHRHPGPARILTAAIAAALAAAAPSGGAAEAAPADRGAPASAEFRRLDANRDGYLSRTEARSIKGFEKAFQQADDNRDGRLDADEFIKAQAVHDRVRAGRYVEDSVITARVKAALLGDPIVSAFALSVETYKGIVLLSGFVKDLSQAKRAGDIAAGVQGVLTVRNALAVKS